MKKHEEEAKNHAMYDEINIGMLIRLPRFFFGLSAQVIVAFSIQYIAPTFSVHMKKYGFSPAFVGLCFCVPAIIYASLSPIMYLVVEKISRRATIFLGILALGVGMAFVGTSKSLGLENNPAMIIMGLMIIGAASGMVSVPVLPEMLEAVQEARFNYDMHELENRISSLFCFATGIGESLGPIVGSSLYTAYGFHFAQEAAATFLICWGLLYFICCGNFHMFYSTPERLSIVHLHTESHVKLQEQELH